MLRMPSNRTDEKLCNLSSFVLSFSRAFDIPGRTAGAIPPEMPASTISADSHPREAT